MMHSTLPCHPQNIRTRKKQKRCFKEVKKEMIKQIKLLTLKQSGEKSVREFSELINFHLRNIPNSRMVAAFMPNTNKLYAIIEYDIDETTLNHK